MDTSLAKLYYFYQTKFDFCFNYFNYQNLKVEIYSIKIILEF